MAIAFVTASAHARAQEGSPAVFRSAADLVALNVIVTDHTQQFVNGLSSADFIVLENGVAQDVSFFAAADVPLDLALLLDTSGSMSEKMPIVQAAATGFLETLRPGDRAMIVDIKNSTRVAYPLGSNLAAAIDTVKATRAGGGTGLFNGLYLTMKELVKARRSAGPEVRRQAIVVLSDGMDTASLITFEDVMETAKQSGVPVYTITVRSRFGLVTKGRQAASPSEFAMKTLAAETGARPFFPDSIAELGAVYGSIGKELASQYALAYVSKNVSLDGSFRRIVVRVPDRPNIQTRTRSGYMAVRAGIAGE